VVIDKVTMLIREGLILDFSENECRGDEMQMTLKPVEKSQEQTLLNLMEKYEYEFSQYHGWDVEEDGLYGCEIEEEYWEENEKYVAYFIEADGNLAGFVMIGEGNEGDKETDYLVSEFFVMHKYRRFGIGKQAFYQILDKYKGTWQVLYNPKNTTSAGFWERAIDEHTDGKYEHIKSHPHEDYVYEDGTLGNVIYFSN